MSQEPEVSQYLEANEELIFVGKFHSSTGRQAVILTVYSGKVMSLYIDYYWFVNQGLRVGDHFVCYRKQGNMFAKKIPEIPGLAH